MCLAVPGRVVSINDEDPLRKGKVDFSGILKEISFAYVPEARVGDFVIVHVGFALSIIDKVEALKIFQYLKEMGELDEIETERKIP